MLIKDKINDRIYYFRYRFDIIDFIERTTRKIREIVIGADRNCLNKTIRYWREEKGKEISFLEAIEKANDKDKHKNIWFRKPRDSIKDIFSFYSESDIYLFRQPYLKRFGGFRWYIRLLGKKRRAKILEYGCGSAVMTEWLSENYPNFTYHVADIQSSTLDFVRWKKEKYDYLYSILEIGEGKEGIPLREKYDLIVCEQVLEHTPNSVEIVEKFIEHLNNEGFLIIDLINATGGENIANDIDREKTKEVLKNNLKALKKIDEFGTPDGIYVKK